ncbi:hypothetical protein TNCV_5126631 [Trichonephila clavipes]|nr:hypothetical protein TNCV_5126631 [Trichonephila clavipes]
MFVRPYSSEAWRLLKIVLAARGRDSLSTVHMRKSLNYGVTISPYGSDDVPQSTGLEHVYFCDVDVTFRGRPLFRSGATGEVFMSLTGVKAEVW